MTAFGRQSIYVDSPGIAAAPTVNDDNTRGYGIGSTWYDTRFSLQWICLDATTAAALWLPLSTEVMIAKLIGANFNVTTDQLFSACWPLTSVKWGISKVLVTNCSASITTAVGGIYSAASKGGTPIVAAAQAYTGTGVNSLQSLTIAAAGAASVWAIDPYLSLTTPEGSAATADVYIIGNIIPQG